MKRLLMLFCLVLCFCKYEHPSIDGDCPAEPMGFSKKKLQFDVEGGIDSITSRERFKLSPFIVIEDTIIFYKRRPPEYCLEKDTCSLHYNYEGNISYQIVSNYVKYIEGPWFSIDALEEKKMIISVAKNETGKTRNFGTSFDIGNCTDRFEVIQSAE
jgi:hypothetical protein